MFRLRNGISSKAAILTPAHVLVLGISLLLGACASSSAHRTAAPSANAWPSATAPSRVAGYIAKAPIDFEDDGIEAQQPPMRRAQQEPDDPTEPFSPNYGEEPVGPVASASAISANDPGARH